MQVCMYVTYMHHCRFACIYLLYEHICVYVYAHNISIIYDIWHIWCIYFSTVWEMYVKWHICYLYCTPTGACRLCIRLCFNINEIYSIYVAHTWYIYDIDIGIYAPCMTYLLNIYKMEHFIYVKYMKNISHICNIYDRWNCFANMNLIWDIYWACLWKI